jgi:hypothetical protein
MIRLAAAVAALVVSAAAALPAAADPAACHDGISAMAKAANPMNYDPPKHYDAESLAKSRAISAWRSKVESLCPHHSSHWWRAHDKKVSCEGYAGGIGCDVSAIPAHRFWH